MCYRKILVIGEPGVGKSTLIRTLQNIPGSSLKTQAPEYIGCFIDTPGEYLQHPYYRIRLNSLAEGCCCILFVQDCTREPVILPPKFAKAFPVPVIGVITKADLGDCEAYERALHQLYSMGIETVFIVSVITKTGLYSLHKALSTLLRSGREPTANGYWGNPC